MAMRERERGMRQRGGERERAPQSEKKHIEKSE